MPKRLKIKAKNALRLLFQEIRHTAQIFSHLFHERLIRPLFPKPVVKWQRSNPILPYPFSICPISNHSLSISRNTLVGFYPIPKLTSIPSADFPFTQNPWQTASSPRNNAWRRLRSLLNRSQPCQWDASKESPYDQTPKASIPWEDGRWAWDMQYVSVSLKMATVPLI